MFKKALFHQALVPLIILVLLICSSSIVAQNSDAAKGWLKVFVDLEQYYLVIDEDFRNATLMNQGDSLQVEAGKRKVTVVWQTINDVSFTIDVDSSKTTTSNRIYISNTLKPRTSYQTIISQTNLQIATDAMSTIYIDGEEVGSQFVSTILKPGDHTLHIIHPQYGELKKEIRVSNQELTNLGLYNKNPSKLFLATKLIPGAEYLATKRYARATASLVIIGALSASLVSQNSVYSKKNMEYNEWLNLYNNTQNSTEAILYRDRVMNVQSEMENMSIKFNRTLLITTGIYLLATIDSFRKPKDGYTGKFLSPQGADIALSPGVYNSEVFPELSFKYHFK